MRELESAPDMLYSSISSKTWPTPVVQPTPGLVNVGFADVRAIMADAGFSLMGIGTATGNRKVMFTLMPGSLVGWCCVVLFIVYRDAVLNAIQSPLLDIGIERATGIVWNITGGSDLTLFEVNATAEVIYDPVDPGANLIFGAVIDSSLVNRKRTGWRLQARCILVVPSYRSSFSFMCKGSVTLIATGFKRQKDGENRPLQGDAAFRMNRQPSFSKGAAVEIPEFLRKKGRSCYLGV
ncbi:hypothetical protein Ancab_014371 [Ancistrocladus abbreviatus]